MKLTREPIELLIAANFKLNLAVKELLRQGYTQTAADVRVKSIEILEIIHDLEALLT